MLPGLAAAMVGMSRGPFQFVGSISASVNLGDVSLATTGLTGGTDTQVREGDYLVVAVADGNTSNAVGVMNDTTFTWSNVADLYANDDNDCNLSAWVAKATTTPPASISAGAGGSTYQSGLMMVFREIETLDATTTTATGINSNTPNPPANTPASSGAVVLIIGGAAKNAGSTIKITAAPANYIGFTAADAIGSTVSSSAGSMIAAAYRTTGLTPGVVEDPGAFTVSGTETINSWAAITLVLRPA